MHLVWETALRCDHLDCLKISWVFFVVLGFELRASLQAGVLLIGTFCQPVLKMA
jgi:hypothetical protein